MAGREVPLSHYVGFFRVFFLLKAQKNNLKIDCLSCSINEIENPVGWLLSIFTVASKIVYKFFKNIS